MLKKIKEWGKSLNNRLMGIILLCGIVPVIFIVLFVASSYRRGIMEKTESMVENEMEYVSSLISGRLNHAIEICKAAYDEVMNQPGVYLPNLTTPLLAAAT